MTALNVRGFLLASVRRCNCTPTRSRGSRRSPTPRAFLVRVEAELPGRVSSTTRERRQRRLQVASSRPRRVRGAGLRELNVIVLLLAAATAAYRPRRRTPPRPRQLPAVVVHQQQQQHQHQQHQRRVRRSDSQGYRNLQVDVVQPPSSYNSEEKEDGEGSLR